MVTVISELPRVDAATSATGPRRVGKGGADGVNGDSTIQLFGGPRVLRGGVSQDVPEGSKRLLVLVALSDGRVERRKAAGQLWPEVEEARAAGNLRSAHWRLRSAGIDVLESDGRTLNLSTGTVVDLEILCSWAFRVIEGRATATDLQLESLPRDALDLLPGWCDDWVIFERERVRQRLLHALEAMSRQLSTRSRHAEAVEAAMTVVAADPLRDSAHRTLIEAHLCEGNVTEARRAYRFCRETFRCELGIEPSAGLRACLREAEHAVTLLRPRVLAR